MTTLLIDRTPQERLLHHAQILSIFGTLVVLSAVPLAVVALVIEAVVYVRVRLWFRILSVCVGVLVAMNAVTAVS